MDDMSSLRQGGPMWTAAATLNAEDSLDGLPLASTPTRELAENAKTEGRNACSPFSELFPTRLLSENGVHVDDTTVADTTGGNVKVVVTQAAGTSTVPPVHAHRKDSSGRADVQHVGHGLPNIREKSKGVKKHFCATCMSGYTRLSTLNKHTREKHPSVAAASGLSSSHSILRSCPFPGCKFMTRSTSALHVHKRKQHTSAGVKPMYYCRACRKRYKERKVLRQHISKKHAGDVSLMGCGGMIDDGASVSTDRERCRATAHVGSTSADRVPIAALRTPSPPASCSSSSMVPVRRQAVTTTADGDLTTIVVDALSPAGNSNMSVRDTPSPSSSLAHSSHSVAMTTTSVSRHTATVPPVFAAPRHNTVVGAARECPTAVTYSCEVCSYSASDHRMVDQHRRRAHPSVLMSLAANVNPAVGASAPQQRQVAPAGGDGAHVQPVRPIGRSVGAKHQTPPNVVAATFIRLMEKAAQEDDAETSNDGQLFECIQKLQSANESLMEAVRARDATLAAVRRRARLVVMSSLQAAGANGNGGPQAADKFRALAQSADAVQALRTARGDHVDMWLEAAQNAMDLDDAE